MHNLEKYQFIYCDVQTFCFSIMSNIFQSNTCFPLILFPVWQDGERNDMAPCWCSVRSGHFHILCIRHIHSFSEETSLSTVVLVEHPLQSSTFYLSCIAAHSAVFSADESSHSSSWCQVNGYLQYCPCSPDCCLV